MEFLNSGQTITAEIYCEQLKKLRIKVLAKWPTRRLNKGIFFHQDNAKPHVAAKTKRTIEEDFNLKSDIPWYTISHPAYSPDLAPSDFYLFKNLQNYLRNSIYNGKKDTVEDVADYLNSLDLDFFRRGIYKLPERWQEVIERRGEYLDD